MPNSHVTAVTMGKADNVASHLGVLERQHEARIARADRWTLVLDQLKVFQHSLAMKSESLNFNECEAAREADFSSANSFRERDRAIDAKEGVADDNDALAMTADDGLIPTERKLPAHPRAGKGHPSTDAQVEEAAQVVADESQSMKGASLCSCLGCLR